jgi:UDP-N-acetylglucosamine 4-epimerase
VQANVKALLADEIHSHKVYNVACGEQTSLNEMIAMLRELTLSDIEPTYGPERAGDVKHSKAAIDKIKNELGYAPTVYFREGLTKVFAWYQQNQQ